MQARAALTQLTRAGAGAFGRALERSGLLGGLDGSATILAPEDSAFEQLPPDLQDHPSVISRLLRFHLLRDPGCTAAALSAQGRADTFLGQRVHANPEDDGLRIDGARLLRADIEIPERPGLTIHILDRVLFPAELDLLEVLHLSDNFDRLMQACEVLELEDLLRGSLPYTLFAPRGLTSLATWEWHALMRPPARPMLRAYVHRHIAAGRVYLDDHAEIRSLDGARIQVIHGENTDSSAAGRKILVGDIEARNGLIHVIEGSIPAL